MAYQSPFWLTFKQAVELGGHVKRGEKSCPVVFWKWLEIDDESEPNKKGVPFLRYYSVFNLQQCEGIPAAKIPASVFPRREHNPIEQAEEIVANMPKKPLVRHGSPRACYSPMTDTVEMPFAESFRSGQDYYSVLFHELTHSSGHESRLNRKGVAGMGATFLCGQAGIVERTIENSAAYVQGWLERLRNDKRLVVQAAAQAQKSADWILDRQFKQESELPV